MQALRRHSGLGSCNRGGGFARRSGWLLMIRRLLDLPVLVWAAALCFVCVPASRAQRTHFKPGWNFYSPQDDIKLGKAVATDAERQLPLCHDAKVDAYLTQVGKKLAAKLPAGGVQYPWEFHCVNDKEINAFALPGGYVFINRGAIEAADNEAQLAGVMAHELAHVVLRHGTEEATKAQAAQGFVGILGALFGGNAGGALLTELGQFSAGSVLLRYSRTAETEADVVGTQVLYDSGYDPAALADFFQKIEAESKGKNPPEFFSDHPSPEHRVERVRDEIDKLGGMPVKARMDSLEFEAIKREVRALPVVKPSAVELPPAAGPAGPPEAPSATMSTYEGKIYSLKVPSNWSQYGDNDNVTFSPARGVIQAEGGKGGVAYGVIISVSKLGASKESSEALEDATRSLIKSLEKDNPKMKEMRQPGHLRLNGQPGLSIYLRNDSPAGGQETDWLITVARPQGLVSFVCVAPQAEYDKYDKTFDAILDSVRFSK